MFNVRPASARRAACFVTGEEASLLIAPAMRRSGTILGVAAAFVAARALETCENIAFSALGGGDILMGAVCAFNSCWKVYS